MYDLPEQGQDCSYVITKDVVEGRQAAVPDSGSQKQKRVTFNPTPSLLAVGVKSTARSKRARRSAPAGPGLVFLL